MHLQEILQKYAYIRVYVIYAFVVFIISAFAGYYTTVLRTEETRILFEQLLSDSAILESVGPVTLFLIIFFNNTIKAFFAALLGTFFGIAPLLLLIANGYMLGIVSYFVIEEFGLTLLVWGIIPHGIIELPLLIITAGYGFWLGDSFVKKIRHKKPMKHNVRIVMRMFSKCFFPLFFFAAFLEVFVTNFFLTLVI